jgi:hypothetical protein
LSIEKRLSLITVARPYVFLLALRRLFGTLDQKRTACGLSRKPFWPRISDKERNLVAQHRTIPPLTPQDVERFWKKVRKAGPDECWYWTACRNPAGYGQINIGGWRFLASRVAWTIKHGSIPPSLCVLHHCDTPPCCNPDHLFLGTDADNSQDCARKEHHKGPYNLPRRERRWPHKHPPVPRLMLNAHVTPSQVLDISTRYRAGGVTQSVLASEYGISRSTISRIARRENWTQILPPGEESYHAPQQPEWYARGERVGGAKLTAEQVRVIRVRYATKGISQRVLASEYGVSRSTIGLIVERKTWKHILPS